jgi:NADH pyrophosphatase NudC (nudix superfamily)
MTPILGYSTPGRFRPTSCRVSTPVLAANGIDDAQVRFADLRQIGVQVERREGGLLALARAMLFWHARHRFCRLCGSPTRSEEAGHMRRCTNRSLKQPFGGFCREILQRKKPALQGNLQQKISRCFPTGENSYFSQTSLNRSGLCS